MKFAEKIEKKNILKFIGNFLVLNKNEFEHVLWVRCSYSEI